MLPLSSERKSVHWLALSIGLVLVICILFPQHVCIGTKIVSVYATWHLKSSVQQASLSLKHDGFDQSFKSYPRTQESAAEPIVSGQLAIDDTLLQNGRDLVPPVLHHILIGMNWADSPASWHQARDACLALHPSYTAHFWNDTNALAFLKKEYPWFVDTWLAYPFVIQRADSLRYFVLHHYGGIFMDLDLSCRRSLGPLRRFPAVAIAAKPVGISNGFLMSSPRNPLFEKLINAIPKYKLNWLHSYISIMWSTGPMFLSSEVMYFDGDESSNLRILSENYHRLSGAVVTPIFEHLGASSWHQKDTLFIRRLGSHLGSLVGFLLVLGLLYGFFRYFTRSNARHSQSQYQDMSEIRATRVYLGVPVWMLHSNRSRDDDIMSESSLPSYHSEDV